MSKMSEFQKAFHEYCQKVDTIQYKREFYITEQIAEELTKVCTPKQLKNSGVCFVGNSKAIEIIENHIN